MLAAAPCPEFSAATVKALREAPGLATVLLENGSKAPVAPPGEYWIAEVSILPAWPLFEAEIETKTPWSIGYNAL